MPLTAKALASSFIAEIEGVDFSAPVDDATLREIIAALDRYAVCIYRATGLTDDSHIAFSRRLGQLELAPSLFGKEPALRAPGAVRCRQSRRQRQHSRDERRRCTTRATLCGTQTPHSIRIAQRIRCCWRMRCRP
jgi:alpha-ketoglutarate-dependent taurine dioxygenase